MYQMRQGGMQRDMGRDYRQFAGGQPQGMQFPSQGPSMPRAPMPQGNPMQGQLRGMPQMQPGLNPRMMGGIAGQGALSPGMFGGQVGQQQGQGLSMPRTPMFQSNPMPMQQMPMQGMPQGFPQGMPAPIREETASIPPNMGRQNTLGGLGPPPSAPQQNNSELGVIKLPGFTGMSAPTANDLAAVQRVQNRMQQQMSQGQGPALARALQMRTQSV